MQSSEFVSVSSYIRVLEKRLLSSAGIDRAADAPGMAEALRMLSQGSDYNFTALVRPEDYESMLKSELKRVYKLCYEASVSREVVEILACKYDYHNIKAALKEKHYKGRTPPPYVCVTDVAPEMIEALVMEQGESTSKSDLPAHLVYAIDGAKAAFEKTQNPQSIDISLDKSMFSHMLELCGIIGSEMITKHVRMQIDFSNVKALLRTKNMRKGSAFLSECLMPGGLTDMSVFVENYNKTPSAMVPVFYYKFFGDAIKKGIDDHERNGSFAGLERMFDNYLIAETRQAKYITYGPEIVYAYLYSKENEIRQVRILVTGKQNGIKAETLKERLRENYA